MISVSQVVKEVFRDPLSTSEVWEAEVKPPAPTVGGAVKPTVPIGGGAETRPGPTVGGAGNVIIPRFFKLIFLAVFFITIGVLIVQGYIVIRFGDDMGNTREALVSYLQTIGTAGVGAIFGLIGGKVS